MGVTLKGRCPLKSPKSVVAGTTPVPKEVKCNLFVECEDSGGHFGQTRNNYRHLGWNSY